MRRRALLSTTAAVVLGGCASTTPGETTTDRSDGTTTTGESTTTGPRTTAADDDPAPPDEQTRASVVDLETVDRTYALSPTQHHALDDGALTLWFARTATADGPAVLRAWLRNVNEYRETFEHRSLPVLGRSRSQRPRPFDRAFGSDRGYESSLVLVPTSSNDFAADTAGVTRDADGLWRAERSGRFGAETVTLDPGETAFGEYRVVGHPEGVGRPTGVYEFPGHDRTLQIGVWKTSRPGPTADSRFAGRTVPPLGEASTTWYHDADRTTGAYVHPDAERGSLPERVDFTVVNKTDESPRCGHWDLYKLVDGEWFHVAPWGHTDDCRGLSPGRAKTYALNAYHGEALDRVHHGGLGSNVGWLGGGTYAMVAGYAADADQSAALVALTGPERTVVPTEGARANRDGDVVRVRTDEHATVQGRAATLELEPVEDAGGARPVVAEQVMREHQRGLRNALAFVDGDVQRVVLETSERVARRATGYEESRTVAFRDATYRATVTVDES